MATLIASMCWTTRAWNSAEREILEEARPLHGEVGRVDLEQEPPIRDVAVLLADLAGHREQVLLVARVVLVHHRGGHDPRRRGGHEGLEERALAPRRDTGGTRRTRPRPPRSPRSPPRRLRRAGCRRARGPPGASSGAPPTSGRASSRAASAASPRRRTPSSARSRRSGSSPAAARRRCRRPPRSRAAGPRRAASRLAISRARCASSTASSLSLRHQQVGEDLPPRQAAHVGGEDPGLARLHGRLLLPPRCARRQAYHRIPPAAPGGAPRRRGTRVPPAPTRLDPARPPARPTDRNEEEHQHERTTPVTFFSEGFRLVGDLYRPDGLRARRRAGRDRALPRLHRGQGPLPPRQRPRARRARATSSSPSTTRAGERARGRGPASLRTAGSRTCRPPSPSSARRTRSTSEAPRDLRHELRRRDGGVDRRYRPARASAS